MIVLVAFLFMENNMTSSILAMIATGVASIFLTLTGKECGWNGIIIFLLIVNILFFFLNLLIVVGVI